MKILVLCDRYPSSLQDGLSLRVIHYIRCLKDRHSFDLVCYGPRDKSPIVPELFHNIDVFDAPSVLAKTGLGWFVDIFDLQALYPICRSVQKHIESTVSSRNYDVIWDAGSNMLLNVPENAKHLPLLADTVDDGVLDRWRQFRQSKTLTSALRNFKLLLMLVGFNRKFISAAAANLLVSEIDASVYSRICPGKRVEVINNGVDERFFSPIGLQIESKNLVFEGSISFGPNKDGVLYFVKDILPKVRLRVPEVTFTIVGRNPPPEIVALASPGITVTGFVDDVRPYLDRAAVFVCPLRGGAGIKNKVLQAWSMGKAVVATTPSIGGLKVKNGENIIVCDDPSSFAEEVIKLLEDPATAKRIGINAQKTIHEHYTWKEKSNQLEALLFSIVTKGHR